MGHASGVGEGKAWQTLDPEDAGGRENGRNLGHGVWQDGGLPWQHHEEEVAPGASPQAPGPAQTWRMLPGPPIPAEGEGAPLPSV